MATKVFQRGNFVIVEQSSKENPIPIDNFDYDFVTTDSVKLKDVVESTELNAATTDLQKENGDPINSVELAKEHFATFVKTSTGGGYPNIAGEEARAAAYPTPVDGQQIFNQRTNTIETYSEYYQLWLSSNVIIMIRPSDSVLIDRLVYVNGSASDAQGARPTVFYPDSPALDNKTMGVIIEIGKTIAVDTGSSFVAVAVRGEYFAEYDPTTTIAAGEFIVAVTNGVNADVGYSRGSQSAFGGVIGVALQDSGATAGKANLVLMNVGIVSESK